MIRTAQMLFANALLWHTLSRDWRIRFGKKRQSQKYAKTLGYFVDLPDCFLSIHCMMENGTCFKKPAGVWYAPSEACMMAARSLNNSDLESIVAVIASDGVIYLDKVTKECQSGALWK